MNDQHDNQQQERLRTRPVERFVGESHVFDLGAVLRDLRAEGFPPQRGHRQMTIFQRKPVTQTLFAFEAGSELREHRAPGLVTIHVLEGALSVQADGQDYALAAGHVLILRPEVPHNVRAAEASAMLLTVHLDDK
jgi:quercetin dioxygenase-like cupin family protein